MFLSSSNYWLGALSMTGSIRGGTDEGNTYISYSQDISCERVMSEVDIVTVSSRGQVSIPADIRRDLELDEGSKLLVISKGDNILFKKIDAEIVDKSFREILEPMWEDAEQADLDEEDAEALVREQRRD
jgi:AbrB family looped-hinge helix DNA binding protein